MKCWTVDQDESASGRMNTEVPKHVRRSALAVLLPVGRGELRVFLDEMQIASPYAIAMDLMVWIVTTPFLAAALAGVMRRTLGTRVGWPRTLAVAVIALSVGVPLSGYVATLAGIANQDDQLLVSVGTALIFFGVVALWVFAACLAALVFLEVVIPTGSLPGPSEALRRSRKSWRRTKRYVQIMSIFMRAGGGSALRAGPSAPQFGDALVDIVSRCGVTFVKLGQILGTRDDLIPPELARALSSLQSSARPADPDGIAELLASELGDTPEAVFSWFDMEPFAAASVAQVHSARTSEGTEVVVKVQRPEAGTQVSVDCDIFLRVSSLAETRFPWAHDIGVHRLAGGLVTSLLEELDYRTEAANTGAIASTMSNRPDIVVPHIYPNLSSGRVLVMERLRGAPLSDGEAALTDVDVDARSSIATELLASLLDGIFVHGVFHADLHPGNILILDDGRIGLLDFGAVGVLDGETRILFAVLLNAALAGDPVATVDAMLMAFDVPSEVDRGALRHQVGREITLLSVQPNVSMASFARMFTVLREHRIGVPGDVAAAFRSLASLERALRLLDPQIDLVAAVRAEVPRLLTQVASPTAAAQAILSTTAVTTAVVRRLPGQLDQIATSIASGNFTLRTRSVAHPDDRRWLRRSANNALGMAAGVTALIVAAILLFVPGGPQLTPQLSGYALVSAVLGFVGVVLCMRTVFRLFTLDNR